MRTRTRVRTHIDSIVSHYSCGDLNKHLLTSDKESMADQSKDTTKIQYDELMSFIGVAYRNMGEGYL